MGFSLEDYQYRRAELEAEAHAKYRVQQLERQGRQQQLRELLSDPKWELFAQEIDKRLTTATDAVDNLAKLLLEGNQETFIKHMPDYRYNLGIKKGFEIALEIINQTQRLDSNKTQV